MKRSSLKRKTALRRVSKKRAVENVSYIIAKEQWREKRIAIDGFLRCQFTLRKGMPERDAMDDLNYDEDGRCWGVANDHPHHRRKRGKWLAYPRFFLALCNRHHRMIHDHENWARREKYLLA